MPTIFIDGSAALDPDLPDRVAHLVDAGHRLVLVAKEGLPSAIPPAWSERRASMPDDAPSGSWYLTADPSTCGDRIPGLRTVLIGPRPDGLRPTRCDSIARDVREAVLQILSAEAMDPAPPDDGPL